MTTLTELLNNPEAHYPGNFDTPERANALLTGLCQDAAIEIERLKSFNLQFMDELLEQCRINGMGADREDALRAEVVRLKQSAQQAQPAPAAPAQQEPVAGLSETQAKAILVLALDLEKTGRAVAIAEGQERTDFVNRNRNIQCALEDALRNATTPQAQPRGEATLAREPLTFEEWLAKQHGDPEEIGFLQALRIAYIAGQDSITKGNT